MINPKSRTWITSALAILAVIIAIAALIIVIVSEGDKKEEEEKQAAKSHVTVQNQTGELIFDRFAQEKADITVVTLKAIIYNKGIQVHSTVLNFDPLISLHNDYIQALTTVRKAASAVRVSRKEYLRLAKLNQDNRNISDKVFQAQGAVLTSNKADLSSAAASLQTIRNAAHLKWGDTISHWIFSTSKEYTRLATSKDVLIEISLPSYLFISKAPDTIRVVTIDSNFIKADLVSNTPGTNTVTQGLSYYYLASYNAGLVPGINVVSYMQAGPAIPGVTIPLSAVVWFQGLAWVYVRNGPDHFFRRAVTTSNPTQNGYFVTDNFNPGELVVVKGAQVLLSQELLPSKPAGGGEEEEGD